MKENLNGIGNHFLRDSFIGGVSALALILLSTVSPFIGTIGIPSVSASIATVVGKWIIIVLLAPLFETILFQGFAHDFFFSKLKFNYFISAILASLLFSLFHLTAYGSSLTALSGSFLSAFIVGMLFQYMSKYTKSLATPILAHAVLNMYILSKLSIVLG